ncbi:MAG: hypothetical protein Q4C53_02010 [Clostridia bacterium]|nr:hypothetical protein [Clostridia bacterium]
MKQHWKTPLAAVSVSALLLLSACAKAPSVPVAPPATSIPETTPAPTPEPTAEPAPAAPTPAAVTSDTVVSGTKQTVPDDAEGLFFVSGGARLTLENCGFDQTDAAVASDGALIAVADGHLTMERCTLSTSASGVTAVSAEGPGSLTVRDTVLVLSGNDSRAFSVHDGVAAVLTNVALSLNGLRCTGVSASAGSSVSLTGCTLESAENTGSFPLGCTGAELILEACSVMGNIHTAGDGNAVTLDRSEWSGSFFAESDESATELTLKNISVFTGSFREDSGDVSLTLDSTSRWILTEDSTVGALSDEDATLSNITGNGFNLYYNSELEANAWLNGKTLALSGGGYLIPLI